MLSSILYSLQVFWSGIFILPKQIIHEITPKFNRFLWNGKDSVYDEAKVAWSELCFPKKEGLGLKIWRFGINLLCLGIFGIFLLVPALFGLFGSKLIC